LSRRWQPLRRLAPSQENRSGKTCYVLTEEALAMAAKVESITTVVMVSRGPLYFSGNGFGMEEFEARWRGWTVEPLGGKPPMSSQHLTSNR
jgi:hypothetical protein